jgi:intracellular protein transport protein USO1
MLTLLFQARSAAAQAEEGRKATQAELDDLLMVFGDLEEKTAAYKARLAALGESVSEGEEDDDGVADDDVD